MTITTEDIPYATPYPWDNPNVEELQLQANKKLRKRPFIGTGLATLKTALSSDSEMSGTAQDLLRNLLQQNAIELDVGDVDDDPIVYGATVAAPNASLKEAAAAGMLETEMLRKARSGKFSLFLSLLKNIEGSQSGSIPTKNLLRICCMSIRPGDVPGALDAKEMIMAGLYFLSSDFDGHSDDISSLPLIESTEEVGDLEKRSWKKLGDWNMDEIKEEVLRLEQVFVSSPSSWRWLKREFLSPRLSQKDEIAFFLKGSIPSSAAAKKVNREPTIRKRKAPAATTTSIVTSPSPASETAQDLVSTPVVEATIVAEGSPSNSDA